MDNVLLITYYWPPSGGPGVQRILKFAKYLPNFNYRPIILTVKNGNYPAYDSSLEDEIPQICEVYKSHNIEPINLYKQITNRDKEEPLDTDLLVKKDNNLFDKIIKYIRMNLIIPDAKIGWLPFAILKGIKIINLKRPKLILSSSPPPTVHLIGLLLSKLTGLKWISDFRDPWSNIHYYKNRSRFSITNAIDSFLERKVIDSSDHLICVSENFTNLIASKTEYSILPNGFDSEDIEPKSSQMNSTKDNFIITYMGTLTRNRYYEEYFKKLFSFQNKMLEKSFDIPIYFIGKISSPIKSRLNNITSHPEYLNFKGYLPHKEALNGIKKSNILLLFMEKVEEYDGHIPGKLFEYLATGNFILGVGPETGEANKIVKNCKSGIITSSLEKFYNTLNFQFKNWKNGIKFNPHIEFIYQYSRKNLTKQLSTIIDELIDEKR